MNELEQIFGSAVGITQGGEMVKLRVVSEAQQLSWPGVTLWGHGGRLATHTGKETAEILGKKDAQIYRHNGKAVVIDHETKRIKIVTPAEFGSWCEEYGGIVFQQF